MVGAGPAYSGTDPYVFICYAHQDSKRVYSEIRRLKECGVNVWYDEGISPGEEWSDELGRAIEGADRLLFFVSPTAVERQHCRDEVHFAKSRGIPILAVHLEETSLPIGLELALGSNQAILTYELNENDYHEKLLEALAHAQTAAQGQEPVRQSPASQKSSRIGIALAAAIVALVAGAWWISSPEPDQDEAYDRSITVEPLQVSGADDAPTVLARSLTESIRDVMASYQEIRTIAATRADIPSIGVSYLLGGNFQDRGADWQVRLRLTRAADGQQVWSQSFETSKQINSDGLQDIAKSAARFVRSQIVQDHRCQKVRRESEVREAATAYCAALRESDRVNQIGDGDPRIWIDMARQAVELDPQILHGYTLIADGHLLLGWLGIISLQEAGNAASAAVKEGLAIDPQHPTLVATLANIQRTAKLDYEASKRNYVRALQIAPLDPDAYKWHAAIGDLAVRRGYPSEAMKHYQRSLKLNDSDGDVYHQYARVHMCLGDYRAALAVAELGSDLLATGSYLVRITLTKVRAHYFLGEIEEARKALDEGLAAVGQSGRAGLIGAMALLGENKDVIERYISMLDPQVGGQVDLIIFAYASMGDADEFFEWAHRGLELRGIGLLQYLRSHPVLLEMRSDHRWPALIKQLERIESEGIDT